MSVQDQRRAGSGCEGPWREVDCNCRSGARFLGQVVRVSTVNCMCSWSQERTINLPLYYIQAYKNSRTVFVRNFTSRFTAAACLRTLTPLGHNAVYRPCAGKVWSRFNGGHGRSLQTFVQVACELCFIYYRHVYIIIQMCAWIHSVLKTCRYKKRSKIRAAPKRLKDYMLHIISAGNPGGMIAIIHSQHGEKILFFQFHWETPISVQA